MENKGCLYWILVAVGKVLAAAFILWLFSLVGLAAPLWYTHPWWTAFIAAIIYELVGFAIAVNRS